MQQQIRTQTPKKNKPAASLIISWLIILGVYLLLRLVFVIFGFHLAPVILGGCLAVLPYINELTADGSSILHSEEDYLLLSYVVDSNIEITKELKDGGWDHLILTNPQWIDRFGDPSKLKPVEYGSLANSMQEFLDVQMPILTADGNVLPDGVGLYQYDGETLLAFPVHVALGAAEPIEAKNPLIILVDKPAQSLKASSCMLPLTSSGNVLFAEGEKLQESFDESKLIDYGSIEEFQMNH